MARINIEEKMLNDIRFEAFIDKVGNKRRAIGEWVAVAFVAQKYWGDNKKLIPDEIWELGNFHPALLECRIIEKRDDGYYLKGSEDHFNWYLSRCELSKKAVIAKKEIARIKHETNHMVNRMDNHVDLHMINHMVDHVVDRVVDHVENPPTPTPTPTPTNIYIAPTPQEKSNALGVEAFKKILPEINEYALPTAARMTEKGLLNIIEDWGVVETKYQIENVHNYMESTGKKYKSIDAAVRSFLRKEEKTNGGTTNREHDSKRKVSPGRIETSMQDTLDFTIPT